MIDIFHNGQLIGSVPLGMLTDSWTNVPKKYMNVNYHFRLRSRFLDLWFHGPYQIDRDDLPKEIKTLLLILGE